MLGPALALRTTLTKPTQITDRLQKNVLNRHAWATRDQLRIAIVTWTERTYHRRRQDGLGRLTPIEYETIMTTTADEAA